MSNPNQLLYFASQTYRQVQLAIEKGTLPYAYSDFATQFTNLLETSGDEAYTRQLTTELLEETARHKQTTDYLRQELDFEAQPLTLADRNTAVALTTENQDSGLANRRLNRHTNRTGQLMAEVA